MDTSFAADLAHSVAVGQATDLPYTVRHFGHLPDEAGLTIAEAALVLGIARSTIWAWIKSGRIGQPRRIGRTTRFTVGALRVVMAGQEGGHADA